MAEETLQQDQQVAADQQTGPGPGDKVGRLYKTLSPKVNIGDESTFRKNMQDEKKRDRFYTAISENYNIGSRDQFNGLFGNKSSSNPEPEMRSIGGSAPVPQKSGTLIRDQEVPASDATRTQIQSGGMHTYEAHLAQQKRDADARKATALSKMKAQGIPDTPSNLGTALGAVNKDIENGDLSITQDKDGNPIYGRNASFLEGLETGFKENITSLAYSAPLVWYGYINKDPKKLREVLENEKGAQEFIRNNPQGLLSGTIPGAPKVDVSGVPVSYSSMAGSTGQMLGGMAPMVAATALVPEGQAAASAARAGASISPELIASINPILAKSAVAGTESFGANLTRTTQQLYEENKNQYLQDGMKEDEAKDKAAQKAVEDAPLQAFVHSIPDAVMFGGAAGGGGGVEKAIETISQKGAAAQKFLSTVEHAAKRTVGFGAVGGTVEGANLLARKIQGYKDNDPGGAIGKATLAWMGQAAAFELLPVLRTLPKYLQSEVKDYVVNNVSKPVLDKILQNIPNGADITSQLEKWNDTTTPLKAIVPPDKMPSIGGLTDKVANIKNDITDIETRRQSDLASAEIMKQNLPEALHGSVDEHIKTINSEMDARIADKQSQVDVANRQIEEMLKSDNPISHEYDDMTGQRVIPKSKGVNVELPEGGEGESVTKPIEPEIATKGTKIILPETNKTPERVELKKKENVQKTEEIVSKQPETERIQQPAEPVEISEEQPAEKPKTGGFSRLKERKLEEPEEIIPEKDKQLFKQASEVEDTSPKGTALSYFTGGGKISSSAMKEFFGDHQSEITARKGIRSDKEGAQTIAGLADSLWHDASDEMQKRYSAQDYREAIEDVLNSHNTRTSMAKELVESNKVGTERVPEGAENIKASKEPELFLKNTDENVLKDIHGNAIEGMPFQHKVKEIDPDLADMKFAVKEQIDKGTTKLSDIQAVAKAELGDVPSYAKNPKKLRDLVEEAYHEVGKESTPKEVTHGIIGAVSKFLDEKFGGKGKKVAVLSNSDSMVRKLNEFGNEPSLHLNEHGEILGFAHEGKMYLNAEHLNPNTPIHEAGHLWTSWAKEYRPDFYKKGMQLVGKSRYLKKVMENEFYQKEASRVGDPGSFKYDEYMKHEALAAAIGDKGAQFVTESTKGNFKKWLNTLWNKVARVTGLDGVSAAKLQDMKFKDFTRGVAKDILSKGEKVSEVAPKEAPVIKEVPKIEGKLSGISHERLNATADELGVAPIPRGKVLNPEEAVQRGRELLSKGIDPESIFREDSKLNLPDKIRLARAHLEKLEQGWNKMTDAEQKSSEGKAYLKDYNDYMTASKLLGTEAGAAMQSLQGSTDAAGNFLQLQSNFKEAMGRLPNEMETAKIKELTEQVKELRKQVDAAEKKLIEQTDADMASGDIGEPEAPAKPKGRKFTEAAKKLANIFRKAKQKPFTFTDSNGKVIEIQKQGIGWNDIVEVGAKVIEKTGEIADGVAAIIEKIKEEGFYAALSEKDKTAFERQLHDYFEGEVVRLSPEARNTRRLEKQLADLRAGNIKEKGTRELSDREIELKAEIADEKKKLGLGRKEDILIDKAEQTIKRLEKRLDDLESGVQKRYTDKGFEMTPEQEARIEDLKFKIKIRKENLKQAQDIESGGGILSKTPEQQAVSLQDLLADKVGNEFTPQESKWVWEYMKNNYLDNGVSYHDSVVSTSRDLGLTFDQMNHAVITPKNKPLLDEVWKKNADLARGRESSKRYVQKQADNALIRAWGKATELPRAIAVWGHAGVFVGTHAKRALLNPLYTRKVVRAFINGYRAGYGKEATYNAMMNRLRADENYIIAQRAGLKNNPDDFHNLDSELSTEHYFNNLGKSKASRIFNKISTSGERGFNAIKILRQEMFNFELNRLPEELKSDPQMLREIAKMVNVSTGATNFKIPTWSNKLLFSAGLESNRWETIIKQPADAIKVLINFKNSTPAQRYALKIYSRNMGSVFGVLLGALSLNQGLNSVFGDENDKNKNINFTDPTKSTWLRFNILGNMSDMTGGAASTISFISKLAKIITSDDYRQKRLPSMVDVATHYGQGKLSPFYSLVAEAAGRHDFSGNTVPWSDERPLHSYNHQLGLWEYLISHSPLPIAEASRTYFENAEKQGIDHDVTGSVLGGLLHFGLSGGVGITYYHRGEDRKPPSGRTKRTKRRKRSKKRIE